MLKLKIAAGLAQIKSAKQANPQNLLPYYVENYADVFMLLVSGNEEQYATLAAHEDHRLDKLKEGDKKSPYYLYTQAEVMFQWALVKFKFGDEASAIWNIRQAYRLLTDNMRKHPTFYPNRKTLGMLQIVVGSIPEQYAWLARTFGMKGNVQTGVQNLQAVMQNNNTHSLEAALYLTMMQAYVLNQEKQATQILDSLYKSEPDNLLLVFLYSAVLMKESKSETALKVLNNRPQSQAYLPFYFMNYQLGDIYLQKGEYELARKNYGIFQQKNESKHYIKDSYYKVYLSYWLNNEDAKAQVVLAETAKQGITITDADKQALQSVEAPQPNKLLTKVRLYTDGGYFKPALGLLHGIKEQDFSNLKDKIEFQYRVARLYHKMENMEKAIPHYLRTIAMSQHETTYYAPNSALQLGYIYQIKNNITLAKNYFNKAMTYRDYAYKKGIDYKAKAALSALH